MTVVSFVLGGNILVGLERKKILEKQVWYQSTSFIFLKNKLLLKNSFSFAGKNAKIVQGVPVHSNPVPAMFTILPCHTTFVIMNELTLIYFY